MQQNEFNRIQTAQSDVRDQTTQTSNCSNLKSVVVTDNLNACRYQFHPGDGVKKQTNCCICETILKEFGCIYENTLILLDELTWDHGARRLFDSLTSH